MTQPTINAEIANAYAAYGTLLAVIQSEIYHQRNKRILIYGMAEMGALLAVTLAKSNYDIYTFDEISHYADIPGTINISQHADWYGVDCDYVLLTVPHHMFNTRNAEKLTCRWIISVATLSAKDQDIIDVLNHKRIPWLPVAISSRSLFGNPNQCYHRSFKKMYLHTTELLRSFPIVRDYPASAKTPSNDYIKIHHRLGDEPEENVTTIS